MLEQVIQYSIYGAAVIGAASVLAASLRPFVAKTETLKDDELLTKAELILSYAKKALDFLALNRNAK